MDPSLFGEGFPGGASSKEQCRRCKRLEFSPWVGKIPWRRYGNTLQYSCLENLIYRGAWWATVHRVAKSWTWLKQLSMPTRFSKLLGAPQTTRLGSMREVNSCQNPGKESCRESLKVFLKVLFVVSCYRELTPCLSPSVSFFLLLCSGYLVLRRHVKTR